MKGWARPGTRLLFVLVLAFIPLVLLEALLLDEQARVQREGVIAERAALAASTAHAADNYIEGNIRALQALARSAPITTASAGEQLNAFLREISDESAVWLTVGLSGPDGLNISALTTLPGTVNVSDRDYFQRALAGQPAVGSAIFARALNVTSVVVAVPVVATDGRRTVLSAALSLEEVERELLASLPQGIELSLADRRGQEFIGPGGVRDTFPVVSDLPGVAAAMRGESGAQVFTIDGVDQLVAYAPAPTAGWAVVLRQPAAVAFSSIDAQRRTSLLLTGLAIAAGLAIATYLGRALARTYADIERARAAVDAERHRLSEVVDELPVAVALYDPEGRALLRNAAYFRLLGGQPPETLTDAVHYYQTRREDGTVIASEQLPQRRALRGEVVRSEPLRLRHAETGEDVHVLVDAVPLARDGDRPIALVVIHDITGLRKTERERTEFFEMASHEIKTPLTVLVGSVELALRFIRRGQTDRLGEILGRAEEGGRRLSDLVRDLLDLTRLDAGRLEIRREAFDLVPVVRAVVDETRLGVERHQVSLDAASGEVMVGGDPRRITQIVQNLVDNAVRYSPEGGPITVSIAQEDGSAVVRVADRGVGIPEDERAQLFQRFFRTSRTRGLGGTGLGLFISRSIAEAHGGHLELERSGPDGTTFALTLPSLRRD